MNDHHLDDLIIPDPEPGNGRSKNILTIIALILIILIVGIILTRLIFSTPEDLNETGSTQLSELVSPELKTANQARKELESAQKQGSQEEIPPELAPITDDTLPKPVEEETGAGSSQPAQKPAAQSRPAAPRSEAPKETPKQPKPAARAAAKKPAAAQAAKPRKPRPVAQPKKRKKVTKPSELFKKSTGGTAAAGRKTYYVQIGSFAKKPNDAYLQKVRSQGYSPILVQSGGMIKVRVGPYGSYGDAKAALPTIKEKLGIAGFVVRKQ